MITNNKKGKVAIKDQKIWMNQKKNLTLQSQISDGVIAQLVEQRTENPCVPGSIPGDTTENKTQVVEYQLFGFFLSTTPTQSCRHFAGNFYMSQSNFIRKLNQLPKF